MAASLARLAMSAPEKPMVARASDCSSTLFARGLFFVCILRISCRPLTSGRSTVIWRSKRPGRSRAGSSTSGRLVAAIITILVSLSKPSISESSWFRVCSRSSCPPPKPVPRRRPTASISSTKMMAGAFSLARLKRSRTRDAPTPTNISTNSEAAMLKKGHIGFAGDRARHQRLA